MGGIRWRSIRDDGKITTPTWFDLHRLKPGSANLLAAVSALNDAIQENGVPRIRKNHARLR